MKRKLLTMLLTATLMVSAAACNQTSGTSSEGASGVSGQVAQSSETKEASAKETAELENWTKDSPAAKSIMEYVAAVTDQSSDSYVPPAERVAVFDSDGTLYGELFPTYFDQCLMMHRILHDDSCTPTEEVKAYAEGLEKALLNGEPAPKAPRSSGQILAEVFQGFTLEEYRAYIRSFMAEPAVGFEGMTYAEGFYRPMISLVQYLAENDFRVFICSGAEANLLRELTAGTLDQWIPPYQVIGTEFAWIAPGQGDTAARDYTYQPEDKVILEGNMTYKNLKMNKVVSIVNHIGIAPTLAVGNSSGDLAMAQYTIQHGGKAYMLLCDDTQRDYGDPEEAASFAEKCKKSGIETVSMKNDFATIYGENVVMKKAQQTTDTPDNQEASAKAA